MNKALAPHIAQVRLRAEAALVRRLNAGYGFADVRVPAEIYLRDDAARERLTRESMRPQSTHAEQAAELRDTIADADAALVEHRSPLVTLCGRFALDAAERALLAVCVAYALDPDVRVLCHALAGRRRAALFGDVCQELSPALADPAALLAALHPSGALRLSALLEVDEERGEAAIACSLVASRRVLDWLLGDRRIAAPLHALVRIEPHDADVGVHLGDALATATDRVTSRVAERLRRRANARARDVDLDPAPLVLIQGPPGAGKLGVAHRIARALGRPLAIAPLHALLDMQRRTGERALVARALSEIRMRGAIAYLPGIEALRPSDAADVDPLAADAIALHDDITVVSTRERGMPSPPVSRPFQLISVPVAPLALRRDAWRAALGRLGDAAALPADTAERFASRYVIGPGTVCEVVDDARAFARAANAAVDRETVEQAIGRRLTLRLGSFGTLITRRAEMSDMVLPEDVCEAIEDMIAMVRERSQILEQWGYAQHLGLSRGVSALFSGDPGTGKTMAASVISGALGLELVRIDLSSVVSKWVGETEKHLATIFDEAQTANAMLLFDEADSLFGKRTEMKSAQDRYANLEVNYILQRMETFDGVSILTTNMESAIDPAFLRRLNFRVRFPSPEPDERLELWRRLIPPETGLGEVDLSPLARRFEMTGGHIRNAIVRAAVIAAREGRAMTDRDLVAGAHHEYLELGKVMTSLTD